MYVLDFNVLIYAFRQDAPQHRACYAWLNGSLTTGEGVGVPSWVEREVLRINTLPSLGDLAAPPQDVFAFLYALRKHPAYQLVEPGPNHLPIFEDLCQRLGLRGNDLNDAFMAALAIERGATLVSTDRGFSRFPGLRRVDPLEE
ncbi:MULTISPECIES: TA system VapC family ribonuclease toxin [unclassified Meiothermus]|uniref:TA system VapC family ribonuclease toxin n=1 Tax=unclassified Meiothermus TaxID=370471 RepID=UPI000D7B98C5|nr:MULTISPECIES: TA system VapC family ribonuclease toxin [unclassified Meiothermus]PZA05872.1 VapC toxin family PIN domain ribonuclease [Meiothermus sp. Pnk-1]RYM30733.1 PIN domain-containing protein [Meiothermus sp. PNK-Is4]